MPGMIQHNPTMHFDTKTGKWQANMFPPEMPQGGGGKRSISSIAAEAEGTRRGMAQPPGRQDSFSSVSSSSSYEDDLAYGKLYDKGSNNPIPGRPLRVMSHDRERPTPFSPAPPLPPLGNVHAPAVELDWYATQSNSMAKQKPQQSAMAQAVMQPLTHSDSRSQPNLLVEMDGTSSNTPSLPQVRPVMVELDARETERYKAYGR
jgi:hypothetical protein